MPRIEKSFSPAEAKGGDTPDANHVQTGAPVEEPNTFPVDKIIIHFEGGSDNITLEAKVRLDRFVAAVKQRPFKFLDIVGYTDNIGWEYNNLRLSEFRANIVKGYFIGKGIESEKIKISGKGPETPIASNETPEGRKVNRRVEVEIIK